MRIASLLPSATEIVCALGLADQLVGVSHECDYPPATVSRLPVLSRSAIDATATSRAIHQQVAAQLSRGLSLYEVDEERLKQLAPDLIVTQDTCRVCAVSLADVQRAAAELVGHPAQVVSLAPQTLDEVFAGFVDVATAAGVPERAASVVTGLRARLDTLAARVAGRPRPRVLGLEWLDPPMPAGHWSPELIHRAGGEAVGGYPGQPTRSMTWETVTDLDPEVILVMPCGFTVSQTEQELPVLLARPQIATTRAARDGRVHLIDGNAYFNRPGPRLVDSAELAAALIHSLD